MTDTVRLHELIQELLSDPCLRGFKDPMVLRDLDIGIANELNKIEVYITYLEKHIKADKFDKMSTSP